MGLFPVGAPPPVDGTRWKLPRQPHLVYGIMYSVNQKRDRPGGMCSGPPSKRLVSRWKIASDGAPSPSLEWLVADDGLGILRVLRAGWWRRSPPGGQDLAGRVDEVASWPQAAPMSFPPL